MRHSIKSALKYSPWCRIVLKDRLERRGRDEGKVPRRFLAECVGPIHGVMENAHDLDDLRRDT